MNDRSTMAAFLMETGIEGDLAFDTASNEAERKYAAMPERIYIILSKVITYAGARGGHQLKSGYNVEEVQKHLLKLRKVYNLRPDFTLPELLLPLKRAKHARKSSSTTAERKDDVTDLAAKAQEDPLSSLPLAEPSDSEQESGSSFTIYSGEEESREFLNSQGK